MMDIKMPSKRLKCEYEGCSKSYCSSFNLKRHIELIHLGVKKFKCSFCSRFLSSKQNLLDHLNIHTGSKPYICEIPSCSQAFRQLSQYYIHRKLHSEADQEPYTNYISESTLKMLTMKLNYEFKLKIEDFKVEADGLVDLPKISQPQEWTHLPNLGIKGEIEAD